LRSTAYNASSIVSSTWRRRAARLRYWNPLRDFDRKTIESFPAAKLG
jgi:hypothetical protein